MPKHPKTISLTSFKGLNNVLRPERTSQDYLKLVENIDIDKSGGLHKRLGYRHTISGDLHSLWSDGTKCFGVLDNNLVEIKDDFTTTVVIDSDYYEKVSFELHDGNVYFSSPEKNGIIDSNGLRPWGIVRPNSLGDWTYDNSGTLLNGTYQYTFTFIDDTGRESGAPISRVCDVPDYSEIIITNLPIPFDANVVGYRVYVSTRNGEVLYFYRDFPINSTEIRINSPASGVVPLQSFNKYHAPNGHIVRHAHGRMWVAEENTLWYSEPMTYEWFDYQTNFFSFSERIRGVMPTTGGMWVCADGLYYLAGKDPSKMYMELKEPVKLVEGTDVKIPGAYIFIENTPIGYKWLGTTNKGIYVFFNDGITLNMTEKNVAFPEALQGTGIFVQKDGINRYTSILEKEKDPGNMAIGDQVTTKIIRNGIVLED